MSTRPIIGDAKIDHWVEVASTSFLHHKITVFPFVIDKYLMGKFFETL